ncbi:MAG: carbohydrate ABC transporter permease [Bacilli bacterium]|nr:carbohydrate ABC transporter permease [Bacilli bacterium]
MKKLTEIDVDLYKKKTKRILFGKQLGEGLVAKIVVYFLLITLSFIFIYPLLYMFSTSLKNIDDLLDTSVVWIPREIFIENYRTAAKVLNLPTKFKEFFQFNTLYKTFIVVGAPALASTVACCLIGYGLSRFNFPLKKMWLVLMIFIFIVPQQIILLPQFVWFKKIGILGKIWSYILPALGGQGLNATVFILIFYSFFNMIPKSLDEAAYLDGANEVQVFTKVGLRLSFQPVLIVFIFNIVWYWNDFYRASYFLTGSKWTTLPLELTKFENRFLAMTEGLESQIKNIYEPLIMAGTILTILPIIIFYFFLQRYFVESVDRTGITGE